jgi:hypothetical protein
LARTGRPIAQLREFEAVRFASGKKTKHPYILYSRARAAHPIQAMRFFQAMRAVVAHRASVLPF